MKNMLTVIGLLTVVYFGLNNFGTVFNLALMAAGGYLSFVMIPPWLCQKLDVTMTTPLQVGIGIFTLALLPFIIVIGAVALLGAVVVSNSKITWLKQAPQRKPADKPRRPRSERAMAVAKAKARLQSQHEGATQNAS